MIDSSDIATVGMFNIGRAKLFCSVGIGVGACFLECTGDGRTGDAGLGVRLIRRGCVVNDVSALFDVVMSFFSLIGGGGIMPCFGSIFIGTGREIAMSVDVDGAGALRLTTFGGPVGAVVDLIILSEVSFISGLVNNFGHSVNLLESVLVICINGGGGVCMLAFNSSAEND